MDIDSILTQAGINLSPDSSEPAVLPASLSEDPPQVSSLSEEDLNNILEGMGFQESAEYQEPQPEEPEDDSPWEEDEEDMEIPSPRQVTEAEAANMYIQAEADHQAEDAIQSIEVTEEMFRTQAPAEPEPAPVNTIPTNSPTFSIDTSNSRFSGAEWFDAIRNSRIILAGLGGIGSWCALQLARMTPTSLVLYDADVVEEANMSGQLYGRSSIGLRKSVAMEKAIKEYTSTPSVYALSDNFTDSSPAGDIMICGFDSMEARRTFFNKWQAHVYNLPSEERNKCLFIDGRLSMDTFQVLCITGDDEYNIGRYRDEFLFWDREADRTVCSMKQTTYLACMIGSYMVNMFTNFIANTLDPIIPYSLPFFTEYDAEHVIFKIEN